jgi:hypothetical protein
MEKKMAETIFNSEAWNKKPEAIQDQEEPAPASPLPISGDVQKMALDYWDENAGGSVSKAFIAGHQARDVEVESLKQHNLKLTECLGEFVKWHENILDRAAPELRKSMIKASPEIVMLATKAKSLIKP